MINDCCLQCKILKTLAIIMYQLFPPKCKTKNYTTRHLKVIQKLTVKKRWSRTRKKTPLKTLQPSYSTRCFAGGVFLHEEMPWEFQSYHWHFRSGGKELDDGITDPGKGYIFDYA